MLDVNKLFFNHAEGLDSQSDSLLESSVLHIDAASRVTGQSMFIIDFDAHELIYKSKHLLYVDEATSGDIKRECANPYWSLVSETTLEKLISIRDNYLRAGEDLNMDDYQNHINVIDYPIILRGHELFITQKFTPLKMRGDNITKVGLFTICHSNKVDMESYIIAPSGVRYIYDFGKNRYIEYNLNKTLTIVEKAILHRARMGMTTEQIAENLFISVNTVKTHKLKIFKKLQVNTITEALAVVGNYQLL